MDPLALSQLQPGHTAKVVAVELSDLRLQGRLADLGLRVGQTVRCLQHSPTGGVSSYQLSHGIFALEDHITKSVFIQQEKL